MGLLALVLILITASHAKSNRISISPLHPCNSGVLSLRHPPLPCDDMAHGYLGVNSTDLLNRSMAGGYPNGSGNVTGSEATESTS
ncbi:hypothetical protein B0J11DRAFT_519678 [Dendryphion nanum]|uniref:Uncharacterized protein n=1 Tax=Dendryphion nanum TaxID=256645 RepID=A0A9P9ECT5_9PLEO|nr:hypothetical protein B0J11DRAFT_519678 [Dendryphion nanum]